MRPDLFTQNRPIIYLRLNHEPHAHQPPSLTVSAISRAVCVALHPPMVLISRRCYTAHILFARASRKTATQHYDKLARWFYAHCYCSCPSVRWFLFCYFVWQLCGATIHFVMCGQRNWFATDRWSCLSRSEYECRRFLFDLVLHIIYSIQHTLDGALMATRKETQLLIVRLQSHRKSMHANVQTHWVRCQSNPN